MKKLASIAIAIPYKQPGNVIYQRMVGFDVFRAEDHYLLIPVLEASERRIANLPDQLEFSILDGMPRSLRGDNDGNFHVISDAVKKLNEMALDLS